MIKLISVAALIAAMAFPACAQVQVQVDDAWVRATVPQQKSTGAFMRLTAHGDARVVSISSPAAAVTEIHEMKMENDIMKMRAVQALDLPAGQAVELKPGGYHVMLINLKAQVKEGDMVPLTLVVEGKDGKRETLEVHATAKPLNQPQGQAMQHQQGHMPKH
ncbi:MAG: copper chaperone PCu(A)C [Rhodocyclales bacterium]|nr:copper chaperone PCu(A)C [Rhodocyclales bacterium]